MLLKATAKREGLFAKQGHAKHNVKDKSPVEQIWSDGLPLRSS